MRESGQGAPAVPRIENASLGRGSVRSGRVGLGFPGGPRIENGGHDAPGLVDLVEAQERRVVAFHDVDEQLLVRRRRLGGGPVVGVQMASLGFHGEPRGLRLHEQVNALGLVEPEHQPVRLGRGKGRVLEELRRRLTEAIGDLGDLRTHPLAGPQIEGHALPPPAVQVQRQRREGLGTRRSGDAGPRGRNILFLIVLSMLFVPIQITIIPLFILFSRVGLTDTYWALILPIGANVVGVFLMRQFFLSIPGELEEAARVDGASTLRILWSIVLPLARPALTAPSQLLRF